MWSQALGDVGHAMAHVMRAPWILRALLNIIGYIILYITLHYCTQNAFGDVVQRRNQGALMLYHALFYHCLAL